MTASKLTERERPDDWLCEDCERWIVPTYSDYSRGWVFGIGARTYDWPPEFCPHCNADKRERANKVSRREAQWEQFSAKIPPRYQDAKLVQLKPAIRNVIRDKFLDQPSEWLLLICGGIGVGKTHAGFASARYTLSHSDSACWFWPVTCMLAAIRADNTGKPRGTSVEELGEYDGLLFMDDLGVEKASEFTIQELYRVINHREMWGLRTIITTNLTLDEIQGRLNDRIASRLSTGIIVEIQGPDRRLSRRGSAGGSDPVVSKDT